MSKTIPEFALRAYALFFSKHGSKEAFAQPELDWIVGQSMRKKIFAVLLKAGWIRKKGRSNYACVSPGKAIKNLLESKVPHLLKAAEKPYALANLSAIEVWSDYVYVQRGIEKSPYFIKILKKDLKYWKSYFAKNDVPCYVTNGATIGEYVVLIPSAKIEAVEKNDLKVEPLAAALKAAKENEMHYYAYNYMREKYGSLRSHFHKLGEVGE